MPPGLLSMQSFMQFKKMKYIFLSSSDKYHNDINKDLSEYEEPEFKIILISKNINFK